MIIGEEITSENDIVTYSSSDLMEDEIKIILEKYLISNGWNTKLAMGKIHGIDIDAYKGNERWIIEVKLQEIQEYKQKLNVQIMY